MRAAARRLRERDSKDNHVYVLASDLMNFNFTLGQHTQEESNGEGIIVNGLEMGGTDYERNPRLSCVYVWPLSISRSEVQVR